MKVEAISVNPVDTKVRRRAEPEDGGIKVLGWDAAGTVVAGGAQVSGFAPGDAVFYAGDITRPGTNAELHCVDARIVGRKPQSLDWAAAAALPLTAITAWETLFDRLDCRKPVPGAADALLIVGGAGGVGSIAIQLARQLTNLTVIATASRPETVRWCQDLGAHHVVDHAKPLAAEVAALGIGAPGVVFSTTNTDSHLAQIAELIARRAGWRSSTTGHPRCFDPEAEERVPSLGAHVHRSMFGTPDIAEQGRLLNEVSRLVDEGRLRTTLDAHYGAINAGNLRRAHAMIESGRAKGKIVLEGFGA